MRKAVLFGGAAAITVLAGAALAQVVAPPAEVMTAGQDGYTRNCQVCHGANGEGGIGFRLDGNPIMQSSAGVVEMILEGNLNHGMPPFGTLSDEVIAAIATYVRNSWANSYGLVEPPLVAQIRANIAAGGGGGE
ncbi:MAG: cytochrome c [Bauldia sp.]|nr:cytochrome c [Bauldia sp.]